MNFIKHIFTCTALFLYSASAQAQQNKFSISIHENVQVKEDSLKIKRFIKSHMDTVNFKFKKDYQQSLVDVSKARIKYLNDEIICKDEAFLKYVNNVYTKLQKANPSMSKDLNIFTSHSLNSNAMYLGFNLVVVNNGLFYKFDTEDQLAIVLAHEIAHHELNHVHNRLREAVAFKNDKELQNDIRSAVKSNDKPVEQYEKILRGLSYNMLKHSRSNEFAADSLAFIYASNAGYSPAEFVKSYESLQDETPAADTNTISISVKDLMHQYFGGDVSAYLNTKALSSLYTDKKPETDTEEDEDEEEESADQATANNESRSTHPELDTRINYFKDKAASSEPKEFMPDSIPDELKEKVVYQNLDWLISNGNGDLGYSLYHILYLMDTDRYGTTAMTESLVFVLQHIAFKSKEFKLSEYVNLPSRKLHADFNLMLQVIHGMNNHELHLLAKNTYQKYSNDIKNSKNAALLKANHEKL